MSVHADLCPGLDAWVGRYDELVGEVALLLSERAQARRSVSRAHSDYGRRLTAMADRAVARSPGQLKPQTRRVSTTRRDAALGQDSGIAAKLAHAYTELHLHRVSCDACRDAHEATLLVCYACGIYRRGVVETPDGWEVCAACTAAGVVVPC